MLIQYSNLYKLPNLKNLCKINHLKNYSKLNKPQLINHINSFKAVCFIQQFMRRKWIGTEVCPITLDSLEYPFISLKNKNKLRYYSLDGLIGYYNSSKDFRDPFTKETIVPEKIKEINTLAKFYKKKQINVSQRNNISLQRRTELLTILCCLNDIINNIMSTAVITSEYIYNFAIPQIMTYVYYLLIRCRQQARSIVQHFIDILERHNDINKYHIINYLVGIMINEDI